MIDLNGQAVEVKEEEQEYKRTKVALFDWLTDLNYDKQYLFREETAPDFTPFMINRGMSQSVETIMYANELNKHWQLTKEQVHDFYFYLLSKKKRFNKWAKQSGDDKENIDLVVKHYGVNRLRALEYLKLLTPEDLQTIKASYDVGGRSNDKSSGRNRKNG
jgi:hypothetical protein